MIGSLNLVGAGPSPVPVQASGVPISRHFDVRRPAPFDLAKFDRRDPHVHFYLPVDCPHSRRCSDGCCPLAHTKLEKIFHPIVYKTQTCQMSLSSRCEYYSKCAFYHNDKDRLEADAAWRLWEHRWSSWRQQVDQILGMHNKLEKEIKRKVDGILKIRMPRQQPFQRQQQQRQAAVDAHAMTLNQATTCHQDAQSRQPGLGPISEPHLHSYQRMMQGAQAQQHIMGPVVHQVTNTAATQGVQNLLNMQQSALHIDQDKGAAGVGFQVPPGSSSDSQRGTAGDSPWLWVAENTCQPDASRSGVDMHGAYDTSFGFRHTASGSLFGAHTVGRGDTLLFASNNGDSAGCGRTRSSVNDLQPQKIESSEPEGGSGHRHEGATEPCATRPSSGLQIFPGDQHGRSTKGFDVTTDSPAVFAPRRGARQQIEGGPCGLHKRQGEAPGCFGSGACLRDSPEDIWHVGTKQYTSFRPHPASRGYVGEDYTHSDGVDTVFEDDQSGGLDLSARGGDRRREEEAGTSLAPGSAASCSSYENFKQTQRQRYLSETIHFGTVQMAPVPAVPGTWTAGGGRVGGAVQSSSRGQQLSGHQVNSPECVSGEGTASREVSITSADAFLTGSPVVLGAGSSPGDRLDGQTTPADTTEAKGPKVGGARGYRETMVDSWDPTGTAASSQRSSVITGSNRLLAAGGTPRASPATAPGSMSNRGEMTDVVVRACQQSLQVRQRQGETAGAERESRCGINDEIASVAVPDAGETGSADGGKGSQSTDERTRSSGDAEEMANRTAKNQCTLVEDAAVSEGRADRREEDLEDAGGATVAMCQKGADQRRLQEMRGLEACSGKADASLYACGQVPGTGSSPPVRTGPHLESLGMQAALHEEMNLRHMQTVPHETGATLPPAVSDYAPYTLLDFCFLDDDNDGSTGHRSRLDSAASGSGSADSSVYFRAQVGNTSGAQCNQTGGASGQPGALSPQRGEGDRGGKAAEDDGGTEGCRGDAGVVSSVGADRETERPPQHGFSTVADPDYRPWNADTSFASRGDAGGEEGPYPAEGESASERAGVSPAMFNCKAAEFYWLQSTHGKTNSREMCGTGLGDIPAAALASTAQDRFIHESQPLCGSDGHLRMSTVLKSPENQQTSSRVRSSFIAEGSGEVGSTGGSRPRSRDADGRLQQEGLRCGTETEQMDHFTERMKEVTTAVNDQMLQETSAGKYNEKLSLLYSAYSVPEVSAQQQLIDPIAFPELQMRAEGPNVPRNDDMKHKCTNHPSRPVQQQGSTPATEEQDELGNRGGTKEKKSCDGGGRAEATGDFGQDVSKLLESSAGSCGRQETVKDLEPSGLQTTSFLSDFAFQPYRPVVAASDTERSCEVKLRGITHYDRGRRSTVASMIEACSRCSTSTTGFEDVLARGDTSSVGVGFPSRASSFSAGGITGLAPVSRSNSCASPYGLRPGGRTNDSLSVGASSTSPESLSVASPTSGSGVGSLSSVPEERHMGHTKGCCGAACEVGEVPHETSFISLAASVQGGDISAGNADVATSQAGRSGCGNLQPELLGGSKLTGEQGSGESCQAVDPSTEHDVQEERIGKCCAATARSVEDPLCGEGRGSRTHEYLPSYIIDHENSAKCSHCVYYQHLTEHLKGMLHTAMEEVQRLRCGPGVPRGYDGDQGGTPGGSERVLFPAPGLTQCERSLESYLDLATPGASLVFPISSFSNVHLPRVEESVPDTTLRSPSSPLVASGGGTVEAALLGTEQPELEARSIMDVLEGIQAGLGSLAVEPPLLDPGGENPASTEKAIGFRGGKMPRPSAPFLSALARLTTAAPSSEARSSGTQVAVHGPRRRESSSGVVKRKASEDSASSGYQEAFEEEQRLELSKPVSAPSGSMRDRVQAPGLKGAQDSQNSAPTSLLASLLTGKQLSEKENPGCDGAPCCGGSGVATSPATANTTFRGGAAEVSDRVSGEGSENGGRESEKGMSKESGKELQEIKRGDGGQICTGEDATKHGGGSREFGTGLV